MSVSGAEERKYVSDPIDFFGPNDARICGVIEKEFEFSHTGLKESFYTSILRVQRLSGTDDLIPIMVREWMKNKFFGNSAKGSFVQINGKLQSRNGMCQDGKTHMQLFFFALDINVCQREEELGDVGERNLVYLEGHVSKPPIFRTTPFGREITDLKLAVKRNPQNGKKDYIPCIAWGSDAHKAREFKVGDEISLYGRIQSRSYFKRYSPDSEDGEWRTVHEVSIFNFDD